MLFRSRHATLLESVYVRVGTSQMRGRVDSRASLSVTTLALKSQLPSLFLLSQHVAFQLCRSLEDNNGTGCP